VMRVEEGSESLICRRCGSHPGLHFFVLQPTCPDELETLTELV
jgi:hypothetical protein